MPPREREVTVAAACIIRGVMMTGARSERMRVESAFLCAKGARRVFDMDAGLNREAEEELWPSSVWTGSFL